MGWGGGGETKKGRRWGKERWKGKGGGDGIDEKENRMGLEKQRVQGYKCVYKVGFTNTSKEKV